MTQRIAALVLTALIASPASAQEGNATRGAELAQDFCAQCHDISATGPMKQHPPAFAAIARFRPEEQIRASIWFPALHEGMPQVINVLDRQSVADLTAYILSLE
jgi:mono/diheme cytochrome c family protein